METIFSQDERARIFQEIRQKYAKAARSLEGLFRYPTGRAGLEALGYDPDMVHDLPESVAASYCGVGNPFALGPIQKGEAVLDIGCGAGVDSLIAARMVGSSGSVRGIDLVPDMLDRAKTNARLSGAENIEFMEGSAEQLPFPDASFEVVISNGVFNLVVDKVRALEEVLRVLKSGGRFMIADQILAGELPKETRARVENWAK